MVNYIVAPNIDKEITAILKPFDITLDGFSTLWFFTILRISPGLGFPGVIDLAQPLLKVLFDCHFLI